MSPQATQPLSETTLAFDDNRALATVLGNYDQNLARIERRLNVRANANGNQLTVKGTPDACAHARRVVERLYLLASSGMNLTLGDVDGAIEECALQGELFEEEAAEAPATPSNSFRRASAGWCARATPRRTPICAR